MIHLTKRETATVLAALRHWQDMTDTDDRLAYPHFDECMPLDDIEINYLCEDLNE